MKPLSPQLMALHKVKNLLRSPDKWVQGTAFEVLGPSYCVAGAIMAVCDDPILRVQICDRVGKLLPNSGIEHWNDRPGRTHADVIEMLEQAILNQEMADAA